MFQTLHQLVRSLAADLCICADGGANRLYDAAPGFAQQLSASDARKLSKPAVIAGDLDSISSDVKGFYQSLGTRVVDLSHDQDTTDLQKCLNELKHELSPEQLADSKIIAAGQPTQLANALSSAHSPHM